MWHTLTLKGLNFRKSFNEAGFQLRSTIIWNKNALVMGRADYHWKHEPILYGWKEGASHVWAGDRTQTTVWDIDKPKKNTDHPTMKPLELCEKAIINSSKPKDLITDLFLGSGSTLIACEKTNRKCYGMELDEKYCDVIVKRYVEFCKKNEKEYSVKRNGVICNDFN
jgi:DNA modification methylase